MKKCCIIALEYLEKDFTLTMDCVIKVANDFEVFLAKRDGVGSISRAFNDAFIKYAKDQFEYVWFVTNITFAKEVPFTLLQHIQDYQLAAIHPAMKGSDHPFLRPNRSNLIETVGFVEFTAPMFRCSDFDEFLLCEETPYWYMDLIICDQLTRSGRIVAVDQTCEVGHTYLRDKVKHEITQIRERLRNYFAPSSKAFMVERYGKHWELDLRFKHYPK